jgi:dTDP-4-dehydrorhamnose reductase
MMKILLTGAAGQLGSVLRQQAPDDVHVTAMSSQQLDIGDAAQVRAVVGEVIPDVIINAAAYTQVDQAESEPELAFRVNHTGVENLIAASNADTRLLHISTDFVFDGASDEPYLPTDPTNPLGVYGKSKLAGEQALLQKAAARSCILRTAWLYSADSKNFLNTMLHLMQTRDELRVVDDQRGTPTSAYGLADAIWHAVQRPHLQGVLHWTDAGETTWYGFACEIQRLALRYGLLRRDVTITPVSTSEYPTPAPRPAYSVLDKTDSYVELGLTAPQWPVALTHVIQRKAMHCTPQQRDAMECSTEEGSGNKKK